MTARSGAARVNLVRLSVVLVPMIIVASPVAATSVDRPASSSAIPPSMPPPGYQQRFDAALWETPELRPQITLFDSPARAGSPVDWSPDGRLLLLAEPRDDGTQLVSISVATLAMHAVAKTPGRIEAVRCAPDGIRVAYVTYTPSPATGPHCQIAVTTMSGDAPAVIAEEIVNARRLEWSPDSRRLAATLSTASGGSEVVVWQLAERAARETCRVTDAHLEWSHPAWSPDGAMILVRRDRPKQDGPLTVIDVGTGRSIEKVRDGWEILSASPDLRYLVCRTPEGLTVADVLTAATRPVLLDDRRISVAKSQLDSGPVWFGDSSAFAVAFDQHLCVVPAATGDAREVGPQQGVGGPTLERFTLAGGVVYYQSTEDEATDGMYVLAGPYGEPRLLFARSPASRWLGPSGWEWSPNGQWGERHVRTWVDERDSSLGTYDWDLLLNLRDGKLYHLTMGGWMGDDLTRRICWSPVHSRALVRFDHGPKLLTLPE